MVYPHLGALFPAGLTDSPQSASLPRACSSPDTSVRTQSILEAQPLTCPCVCQLLGLQADVCTVKVSPRHGTLGPSEERQLSLELTAHTLVSVEPGAAALPREAPAVCILASREICLRPLSWAEAGNRFLELGSGVPFLLGLL